mgnify:CR=1 FL=1
MKFCLVLLLLLSFSLSYAQDVKSQFTFTPNEPKLGDIITLVYDESSPSAVIKDVNELTCQALFDRVEKEALLIEVPLTKEGKIWRGKLNLDDRDACLVLFKLVSGDITDDNQGSPWNTIIYEKDFTPVRRAHLNAGMLFLRGRCYTFRHKQDLEKAEFHFKEELKINPKEWQAKSGLWEIQMIKDPTPEGDGKIKSELISFYNENQDNEKAVSSVISMFRKLNENEKADQIQNDEIKKNPKGLIAQEAKASNIWTMTDNLKMVEAIKELLDEFPSMEKSARQTYLQNLFYLDIRANQLSEAMQVLEKIENPSFRHYNEIAYRLIEKNENLEKAVEYAKKALEMVKNPDVSEKPGYITVKEWSENNKYYGNIILDTYGYGLVKIEKFPEAVKILEEAYRETKGENPEINLHYVEALGKIDNHDKAIEIGRESVLNGKDSPELINIMKGIYARKINKEISYENLTSDQKKKFESMLAEAMAKKIEKIKNQLKESRLNTASIDFSLKDINGNTVTLGEMKGKVVILDFWATWCGPCKSSFPYLQKVYEKYKDNQNVKIFAINSWERQDDYSAQVENAKSFLSKNNYTFPVLIDERNENQFVVITKYEVEGIPTKFIIDKKGLIAWKNIGFENGQYMIDEMTQQIEMLLSE